MVFAILSYKIYLIALDSYFAKSIVIFDLSITELIIEMIRPFLDSFLIGIRYYPILFGIFTEHKLKKIIIGLYILADLGINWLEQSFCGTNLTVILYHNDYIELKALGKIFEIITSIVFVALSFYIAFYLIVETVIDYFISQENKDHNDENLSFRNPDYDNLFLLASTSKTFFSQLMI